MNNQFVSKKTVYKDDYKRFLSCPNFMWLMAYRKNSALQSWAKKELFFLNSEFRQKFESTFQYHSDSKINSGLELRIASGITFENVVAKHFRKKFGTDFFDFESIPDWSRWSAEKKHAKTMEVINQKKYRCLYQPYFMAEKYFVTKCDLLMYEPSSDTFQVYEVKAVNNIDTKAKKDEFKADLRYQCWILKQNQLEVSHAYIIKLNKDYQLTDDDYAGLWVCDEQFDLRSVISPNLLEELMKAYQFLQIPFSLFQTNLLKYQKCHQDFCFDMIAKPSFTWHWLHLYRMFRKKKIELYQENHLNPIDLTTLDLQKYSLSDRQVRMVKVIQKQENIIKDIIKVKNQLLLYNFPLYFYDFESCQFAIPTFFKVNPWTQLPFQYSLHVLQDRSYHVKTKQKIVHLEFIVTDHQDPRISLIKQFVADTKRYGLGTYISYNKSFEISILKNILANLELSQSDQDQINYVINHTVDLMDFFKDFNIYHPNFFGSLSIKKTYPALVTDNDGYQNLAIKSGDVASALYFNYVTERISDSEWQADVEHLKRYCATDTWAMVELFEAIIQLTKR